MDSRTWAWKTIQTPLESKKVDGNLAATRLGQTTTQRWGNERFRQTMLLILEFRREWPGQSLLTADDVERIRTAIDNALAFATTSSHVGDIYDTNPTCWAIWLVQRAHTLKAGGWTAVGGHSRCVWFAPPRACPRDT